MSTEQEEIAARKTRVRAAHRASVTSQLEHVLDSGDALQMKQLRQSLTDKLCVLSKLDDELIDLPPAEQLEEEVQQEDLIKEELASLLLVWMTDWNSSYHRKPHERLQGLPAYRRRTKMTDNCQNG